MVDIVFAGNVNVYHTSLVVPQELVAIPSLVAKYRSPLVVVQPVDGVSGVADEQTLFVGCENPIEEIKMRKKKKNELFAVEFMVFRSLDVNKAVKISP